MNRMVWGFAAGALVLAPVAAWAAHGKAGLWNVTSTTNMQMNMPPEAMAQMRSMGMKMPNARSYTSQMCMSQAEVDSDKPPHIDQNATGCETKVLSQTPTSMTVETTCNGRMKGVGHTSISYRGAEHYQGTYDFKGTVEGNPTNMSTSFKGDWVKTDCGDVKPYSLRTQ
ncbi:MAG TPA: DUF3617 domain-containing protein [Rhizomicrobium sp.]|nr:DUF3617 domain-containing protein [Rhizomicrobium sp.]